MFKYFADVCAICPVNSWFRERNHLFSLCSKISISADEKNVVESQREQNR